MKYFLYASLLLILICACSSTNQTRDHRSAKSKVLAPSPAFDGNFNKALFKASLDIRKQHLSGFLLIKKTDDTTYRVVFANEIGMTMFDLGFHESRFRIHYIFEPMNKKILLRLLENDFRQLIFTSEPAKSSPLMKTIIKREGREGEIPRRIEISNPVVKMNLDLTLISQ